MGVDVGGTFTDRAALMPDGRVVAHKVLTTPGDQGEGVLRSLDGLDARATAIVHGTTVVTNLLLERRGARVVLCTTEGAEDLLFLRRQDRASLYDLSRAHPAPLLRAEDVIGVRERLGVRGDAAADAPAAPRGASVETALDAAEIARVVRETLARSPDIVLVALLHSYADAAHEQALAAALRSARPGLEVVTSADVLPEIREYERFATASAEAYARPAVLRYLDGLGARLAAADQPAPAVMTSAGGMMPAAMAARHAASLALSGPAGGVVGAAAVLRALGIRDALTMDIGGTSADAGLIVDGLPLVEPGGDVAGVPIALPRVLVETVSAGGGSIAWVDDGGALRVGPRSAGARPGPVAFGLGGREPTVTDAQLALGRIAARAMSGGVSLDAAAATAAIAALGARLGSDVAQTARAILAIADAEMARALRRVSVERGVDPRRCVLVAFGGGGPLHACALAEALGMTRVVVPPFAGVLSAVGLALAPARREAAMSLLMPTSTLSRERLADAVRRLSETAEGAQRHTRARMRYRGQGHELEIPLATDTSGAVTDDGHTLAQRFATAHAARYGFTLPAAAEVVALRHEAGEPARQVTFHAASDASHATLYVADGWTATPLAIGGWMLEAGA